MIFNIISIRLDLPEPLCPTMHEILICGRFGYILKKKDKGGLSFIVGGIAESNFIVLAGMKLYQPPVKAFK